MACFIVDTRADWIEQACSILVSCPFLAQRLMGRSGKLMASFLNGHKQIPRCLILIAANACLFIAIIPLCKGQ
jgi:hypothetical protein